MTTVKKTVAQILTGSSIEENETETGFFSKLSRLIMYLAFILMGLGNWSDSKELLTEGYQGFITHFTDRVEQKTLSSLRVGNYLAYTELSIGSPIVIKHSSIKDEFEYRYYKNDKYLLTLITQQQRVSGIVVHSLPNNSSVLDRFSPSVPFTKKHIIKNNIESITERSNDFFFDSNNLVYFMTARDLGAKGMNLRLASGFTDYEGDQKTLRVTLEKLDEALVMDEIEKVKPLASQLTSQVASFYAIYEVETQIIADSLLTRHEFNAYFTE